jgi:hypothetical protein
MRLTLRTLLAYLDDTLDPNQTRQIGEKVAESDTAAELIERIKKVTRRRRLTTPEMVGDPELDVDPNSVAEYLDNVLSAEKIAELEKLCLESDVNLAEVAACHQILAVLLSEPTHVPPTAFQRMYGLTKGAEAIPYKKPGRRTRREQEVSVDGHDEADEPLLLGMAHKPGGSRTLGLIGLAALLLVGLVSVLYFAFTNREPAARLAGFRPFAPPQPEVAKSAPENTPGSPAPMQEIGAVGPMWAGWLSSPAQPLPTKPDLSLASIPLAASWLAARPGMPGQWFLIFGRTEDSVPEQPVGVEPATQTEVTVPGVKPPNPAVVRVGMHASAATRDSLLFRVHEADWRLVRPGEPLESGVQMLVLPGYRSDIALANQVRLEIIGSLPVTVPNYFLETAVTLHASAEADLDLTLHRGRLIISNRPAGEALVRLRFLDQVWDIKLLQPKSEIGVELTGRVPPGSGSWTPHFRLNVITSTGEVEIRRGAKWERVVASRLVPWVNTGRGGEDLQVPIAEPLPWMNRKTKLPDELLTATARFSKRVTDKLSMGGSEVSWVKVACQESFEENRPWERAVALFCLGALDQVGPVLKTLDTNDKPDVRVRALDTLFHFVGRQSDQDVPLRAALKDQGFAEGDAEMILRLLHGFDQNNREVIDLLINNLTSSRLAIRELSFFVLHMLAPADKLTGYDPNGPQEIRDTGARTIRMRLLGK